MFCETCIFDVKPDKVEEFEQVIKELVSYLKSFDQTYNVYVMKRTHRMSDDLVKQGKPPIKLKRIIKSVKFIMFWQLKVYESHGEITKLYFEKFNKRINRLTLMPGTKHLGEELVF